MITDVSTSTGFRALSPTTQIIIQAFLWFFASICGTLVNKSLMKDFPYPISLTMLHLITGITFNLVISRQRKTSSSSSSVSWSYRDIVPVAFFMIASKVFTYVSYGRVPASLTHTIKATSPIFSVLISHFHLKQPVSGFVIFSLLPITIGVTLSSVTEINFELFGFFAALLSTLIGVVQNIMTKKCLKIARNPVELNLHSNSLALVMLAVVGIFVEFPVVFSDFMTQYEKPVFETELVNEVVSLPPSPPGGGDGGISPLIHRPMDLAQMLFCSMLLYYLQSMSSLHVLNKVTAVTHQVSATIKRLAIIGASVWYFGNQVTFTNCFGMLMAVGGFFLYGFANRSLAVRKISGIPPMKVAIPSGSSISSSSSSAVSPVSDYNSRTQILIDVSQKFRANNDFVNGIRGAVSDALTPLMRQGVELRPLVC